MLRMGKKIMKKKFDNGREIKKGDIYIFDGLWPVYFFDGVQFCEAFFNGNEYGRFEISKLYFGNIENISSFNRYYFEGNIFEMDKLEIKDLAINVNYSKRVLTKEELKLVKSVLNRLEKERKRMGKI